MSADNHGVVSESGPIPHEEMSCQWLRVADEMEDTDEFMSGRKTRALMEAAAHAALAQAEATRRAAKAMERVANSLEKKGSSGNRIGTERRSW